MFLEKFTPLTKNFTLPAAVPAVTNLTSVSCIRICASMHVWCICLRNITDPPVSYLGHLLLIIHHDTRSSNQLCKCKIPGTSFWLLALSRNNKVNTQNHPLHFRIHTIDLICVIWCDKWWQLFLSPSGDLGIGLVWDNLSNPIPTANFRSDCWNPLQTELNYLWWVVSCSQDDIRWF